MIIWIFTISPLAKQMNALFAGMIMIPYSILEDACLPVLCKKAWKLYHGNICDEYTDNGTTEAYYLLFAYRILNKKLMHA